LSERGKGCGCEREERLTTPDKGSNADEGRKSRKSNNAAVGGKKLEPAAREGQKAVGSFENPHRVLPGRHSFLENRN